MKKYLLLLYILILTSSVFAQYYFGKNKMPYHELNWQIRKTEHFDIYFYPTEEELSLIAADIAENSWTELELDMRYSPNIKIPIIIYSSHNLFQETNTIPFILSEGVGGFTEYYKGRVVLPFNGSYSDFRHTLKHELVHAFQFQQLMDSFDAVGIFYLYQFPLWLTEGFAEYFSEHGGPEMDNVLRSAILEGDFYPISNIYPVYGTYIMYKEAESFLLFLEDTYGKNTIRMLAELWWQKTSVSDVLFQLTGKTLEENDRLWQKYLMDKYYPMINDGQLPGYSDNMITNGIGYFMSPTIYREDSSYAIICKGNTLGYGSLYKLGKAKGTPGKLGKPDKPRLLLKSNLSEKALSMHTFHNRMDISDSLLVLSLQKSIGDAITLYDLKEEKIISQKSFYDLPSIFSPCFSPNSELIAFSASDLAGFTNIYIYNRSTEDVSPLFCDLYDDRDPIFINDSLLLFCSDRTFGGDKRNYGIYRVNINTKKISALTLPSGFNRHPDISPDGSRMVYTSDLGKQRQNIWVYEFDTEALYQVTDFLTTVGEPRFITNDTIVASVYHGMSYHIAKFYIGENFNDIANKDKALLFIDNQSNIYNPPTEIDSSSVLYASFSNNVKTEWVPSGLDSGDVESGVADYHRELSFEIAQGAVSTNSSMEGSGGIEGQLTDMLGDKRLYFMLYNPGEISSDFFRNFNVVVHYSEWDKRPGWGVGAYHEYYESYNRVDGYFEDERAGLMANVSYPLSRYTRTDASMYTYYYKKTFNLFEDSREGGAISTNLSLIRDTAIWGATGPIEGMRFNLTGGFSLNPADFEYLSYLTSFDGRYYHRLNRRMSLATRAIVRHSNGPFPERFYIGGTWTFRGYPFYYFYGRNMVLLNCELRFPLIDIIAIRTPVLGFNIQGISTALFIDAGNAWDSSHNFDGLYGTFGVTFKFALAGFTTFRFDFAKRTDFREIEKDWQFDFFFGWDY